MTGLFALLCSLALNDCGIPTEPDPVRNITVTHIGESDKPMPCLVVADSCGTEPCNPLGMCFQLKENELSQIARFIILQEYPRNYPVDSCTRVGTFEIVVSRKHSQEISLILPRNRPLTLFKEIMLILEHGGNASGARDVNENICSRLVQ